MTALTNAENNAGLRFVSRLSVIAFSTYKEKSLSDLARRSFLVALAGILSHSVANEGEMPSSCQIAMITSSLIDKFEEFLPSQALVVEQQTRLCLPFLSNLNADLASAGLKEDRPKTADELISAARNTDNKVLKGKYFYEAIIKLEKVREFNEITSLLDDMTDNEKEVLGVDIWESYRIESAFTLTTQSIENKDWPSAYRIIDRTPKKIRPSVRISLAYKLPVSEYRAFVLENLEQARKELDSLDILAARKADYSLSLARLYTKVEPTDAQNVFRETVKAINNADTENPDSIPEKDYAPLRDYISLPAELLEPDELSIFSSFNDISSRQSRVRLKLGLLESSLQTYLSEKKKADIEHEKRSR